MEENKNKITSIKLVLIGDSSVGKTCIFDRLTNFEFIEEQIATIGADKRDFAFTLDNGKEIKIILWDTAGQERFRSVDIRTCKGAHGLFLVFDFTRRESFNNLVSWIREIKDNFYDDDIIVVLFGNKIDIEKENWEITREEAKEYAKNNNLVFFETSAKTNQGINEGLNYIANKAYSLAEKRSGKRNIFIAKPENKKNEKCVGTKKTK